MDVLSILAGILSLILVIIMQEYVKNFIRIEDNKTGTKGILLSPKLTVNCKMLRSQLFQLCKEKDVHRVRLIYKLYLDNCFENKEEKLRNTIKEYFENFLDSFSADEEKEIEHLTLSNTQRNKGYLTFEDKIDIYNMGFAEDNSCYYGSSAPLLSPPKMNWLSEGKIRKQVQINLEPEIKLIERRRRKRTKIIEEEQPLEQLITGELD